ncbi:MAG: BCCT family transporter [Desulfobacterium sp.]|nr:BCCT family transporter [Desulfobacterium sp.]
MSDRVALKKASPVEWTILIPSATIVFFLSVLLVVFPAQSSQTLSSVKEYMTHQLGWLYMGFGFFCVVFLVYMAFTKWGNIKLGDTDETPEFRTGSWIAMIFSAAMGASVLYWGAIEWVYYYSSPPLHLQMKTALAAELGSAYGLFHWTVTPWAIYCVPAIAMSYMMHVRKSSVMRLSDACRPIIGKHADGTLGKIMDVICVYGLVAGAATTLGLNTPLVEKWFQYFFNLPSDLFGIQGGLVAFIILIWTALIALSVYSGLYKGIKILSDTNVYIAIVLLAVIVILGPTAHIFNSICHSVGLLFQNFIVMSLNTDPITKTGFPQGWTAFYWAWWLCYAPFMGLFAARISKGRTIRELIVAEVFAGALGNAVFFFVIGNSFIWMQFAPVDSGHFVDIIGVMDKMGPPTAIVTGISSLAGGGVILFMYGLLAIFFQVTSFDSTAYTAAAVCSKIIDNDHEPARWHRLLWAFALGAVALALLIVGAIQNNPKAHLINLQSLSVVLAAPLIVFLCILIAGFIKMVRQDYSNALTGKVLVAMDMNPGRSYRPAKGDDSLSSHLN